MEHYKGRNYQTTVYRQFVLFPQQSGNLTIDPARFDASIAKATQVSDPFEAFFNGGSNYIEVKKTLMTPKLTVDVKPLPGDNLLIFPVEWESYSIVCLYISTINGRRNAKLSHSTGKISRFIAW